MKSSINLKSQWERSLIRRFGRWLFSKRVLSRLAFGAAALATLVALFYAEEHWRGKRAWTRYFEEFKARGGAAHYSELLPPKIPDDQNFAATPYWEGLRYHRDIVTQDDTNRWPELFGKVYGDIGRLRPWETRPRKPDPQVKLVDLPAWEFRLEHPDLDYSKLEPNLPAIDDSAARTRAAAVVLEALKPYDSVLDELHKASGRPGSRFPVHYDEEIAFSILLPHLAKVKGVVQVLRVKASAELASGRPERALEDVMLMFRLADAVRDEPFIISALVHIACYQIGATAVWEGMHFGLWTESELLAIQDRLKSFEFLGVMRRAFQGERAFSNSFYDFLRRSKDRSRVFRDMLDTKVTGLVFFPSGWIYLEQLNHNVMLDRLYGFETDEGGPRVEPEAIEEGQRMMEEEFAGMGPVDLLFGHNMFARLLLPALGNAYRKAAYAQANAELGRLGCALERFKLARGMYPAALTELVPGVIESVPADVVASAPYRYRREEGGRYVVWSVGWNGTDDGGVEARELGDSDWVWNP